MKKLLSLISVILFLTLSSFAQQALLQGTKTIGGSISFTTATSKTDFSTTTETSLSVVPQFSTFIADGFEIGGNLDFQYQSEEYSSNYSNQSNTYSSKLYGGGLLANKYFPLNETKALYLGGGASIFINPDVDNKLYALFAQGGILLFMNDYAAVNFGGQYTILMVTGSDNRQSVLSFVVGMKYFILD